MSLFLIRGVGFFNDAYDLFVMNVVNVVLEEQYTDKVYTAGKKSAVSAAALIGAVIGQLLFGLLGDALGRRVNMIVTCSLLIFGGIICAAAYGGSAVGTIWFLIFARGILGIGIGGEYPLAASSSAEDATSVPDRNRRVALTFSLQGVGSLTAAIVGNILVQTLANNPKGENDPEHLEIIWRTLFAIGVLPALVIVYFRWKAEEPETYKKAKKSQLSTVGARAQFIGRFYWKGLLGTAGTWFLFDIVFYAQNLFAASVLKVVGLESPSLQQVTVQNVLVALMALPGYYVAVCFINKIGRKKIQLQGFVMMTLIFLSLAIWWDDLRENAAGFIILYGLALFFSNFGPNTSTFVMPTEMFPTAIRGTCHGFSAAMGKAGAAIGAYAFSPLVKSSFGYRGVFFTFAAICAVSIPLTWFCMFDNNQGLDEMDREFEERLGVADEFTRDSFKADGASFMESSKNTPRGFVGLAATPKKDADAHAPVAKHV